MTELDPDVGDDAPSADTITPYDEQHFVTYLRLLDADAEGADWREVARIVLHRDPVAEPEVFHNLSGARWGLDQVNETVGVETVRLPGSAETASEGWPESGVAEQEILAEIPAEEDETSPPPAFITFNPDGSSDTAEITLAARGEEDPHHVTLRIEGLTGSISRLEESEDPAEPAAPDRNETIAGDR